MEMNPSNSMSVLDKVDRLLMELEKIIPLGKSTFFIAPTAWPLDPNRQFQTYIELNVHDPERGKLNSLACIQACELAEWQELVELCQLLTELEFIRCVLPDSVFPNANCITDISIRIKGWKRIEELNQRNPDSQQCFVAMWFDPSMDSVYRDFIKPAIEDAGYKSHRVDEREHVDKIDDEIIRQIRRSHFVVADATSDKDGARGGVYYEAGFAHGLGMKVFWTCQKGGSLHFDVRQYNCIFWESDKLPEFRKKLAARIEAELGRGKIINESS